MKKHFYSHIVEINLLEVEIDNLNLSKHEREHLYTIIHSSLHHTVLDTILSELSESNKKKFLMHIASDDHAKIWLHLKENISYVEEKIKNATGKLLREFHRDIKKLKK